MKDLLHGSVYTLRSRNLVVGVWNEPVKGFIGVRHKWGSCFLDTEFHHDTGAPHGTAHEQELLGELPQGIEIKENFGPYDSSTNRFVVFEDGKWLYSDTKEPVDSSGPIYTKSNTALFEYLVPIDERLRADHTKEWEDHVRKVAEVRERGSRPAG